MRDVWVLNTISMKVTHYGEVRLITPTVIDDGGTLHILGETAFTSLASARKAWERSKAFKIANAKRALEAAESLSWY